jgi:hypothetical protein
MRLNREIVTTLSRQSSRGSEQELDLVERELIGLSAGWDMRDLY